MIGGLKQRAGMHDTDTVQVSQGTGMHDLLKYPAKMSRTHMRDICEDFNGKLIHIVVLYVFQSRIDAESIERI